MRESACSGEPAQESPFTITGKTAETYSATTTVSQERSYRSRAARLGLVAMPKAAHDHLRHRGQAIRRSFRLSIGLSVLLCTESREADNSQRECFSQ